MKCLETNQKLLLANNYNKNRNNHTQNKCKLKEASQHIPHVEKEFAQK